MALTNPVAPEPSANLEAKERIARTRELVGAFHALYEERNELVLVQNSQKRRHGDRDYRLPRAEQPHWALVIELNRAVERVDRKIHDWWAEFLACDLTFETYDFDEVVRQVLLERGTSPRAIARGANPELRSAEINDTAERKAAQRQQAKLRSFYASWLGRISDPVLVARLEEKIAMLSQPAD